jgi:hypothetical protein
MEAATEPGSLPGGIRRPFVSPATADWWKEPEDRWELSFATRARESGSVQRPGIAGFPAIPKFQLLPPLVVHPQWNFGERSVG